MFSPKHVRRFPFLTHYIICMKRLKISQGLRKLLIIAVLLAPVVAGAHPGFPGHTHGFANGFAHPFSGLDHLLAMLAIGIWAVQRGGRALWLAPLAFLSVMTVGGFIGMAGFGQPPLLEQAIAASVLIFGILIATMAPVSLRAGISVIGLFALFHGYAHGAEMPATSSGLLYGLGFVLATASLHFCGIGLGLVAQKTGAMKMVRCAGCLIAACGLYLIFSA